MARLIALHFILIVFNYGTHGQEDSANDTITESTTEELSTNSTELPTTSEQPSTTEDDGLLLIGDRFGISSESNSGWNTANRHGTRRPQVPHTTRRTNGWFTPPLAPTTYNPSPETPRINFTVVNSKKKITPASWDSTGFKASISTKNLRALDLHLVCNATYPIAWRAENSFGTDKWTMEEYRVISSRNGLTDRTIYKIELILPYDHKVPNLSIDCVSITPQVGHPGKQRVQMVAGSNFSLNFEIGTTINVPTGTYQGATYGANRDCSVSLEWQKYPPGFICRTTSASAEPSIDYFDHPSCTDKASCARAFAQGSCDHTIFPQGYQPSFKSVDMLWQERPETGIVYCKNEGDTDDKSDAIEFFYPLQPMCPDDNAANRFKIYVASMQLDTPTLRSDFVSFCPTELNILSSDNGGEADLPPVSNNAVLDNLYIGDTITVSCIASLYHFAVGSRIGLLFRNGDITYSANSQPVRVVRDQGYSNTTAKVHLIGDEIDGLICELFVKQSTRVLKKKYPLNLKVPQTVKILNGETRHWNYTGQPSFQLKCEAEGDPEPSTSWHIRGGQVPSILKVVNVRKSSSILRFPSRPKLQDLSRLQDTYTCKAQNRLEPAVESHFVIQPSNITFETIPFLSDSDLWYVWAIIIPLVVILVLVTIGALIWKIKKQGKELRLLTKAEVDEFVFGKPEFLQHHTSAEEVNNYAPYLPYNRGYEIRKEQLEIESNAVLGTGAYAIVIRGTVRTKCGDEIKVAIKTAKPMDDISYFKALLSELKIMGFIGTHPNIVNLIGAYTKNIQNKEVYIAIEFCELGNLLVYLRTNRQRYTNLLSEEGQFTSEMPFTRDSFINPDKEGLTTLTLMKFAKEVATGMEFLSQKKVIHGDLAGRNILLSQNLVAKIGDFGLSRQLFEYANYIKTHQSPLPWKWLALECLKDMRFSVKSDVWAYSILLYEIFTLGQVPYPGQAYNDEFLEALTNGKRPPKPAFATKEIYNLMSSGWSENPEERPTFTQIKDFFTQNLANLVPQEYLDLHEKVAMDSIPIIHVEVESTGHSSTAVELSPYDTKTPKDTNDGENRNKPRFSFNTKTITAMFHRS